MVKKMTCNAQRQFDFKAERRLRSGDLTVDQHHDLVDKLHQLYELQRHSEQLRHPPDMPPLHPEHQPRHMIPPRPGEVFLHVIMNVWFINRNDN